MPTSPLAQRRPSSPRPLTHITTPTLFTLLLAIFTILTTFISPLHIFAAAQAFTPWPNGPPERAEVRFIEVYSSPAQQQIRIDLATGEGLSVAGEEGSGGGGRDKSSLGVAEFVSRPAGEYVCTSRTESMRLTFAFEFTAYTNFQTFSLDIWPVGYPQRKAHLDLEPDDFICLPNYETGSRREWCFWMRRPERKRLIFPPPMSEGK